MLVLEPINASNLAECAANWQEYFDNHREAYPDWNESLTFRQVALQ